MVKIIWSKKAEDAFFNFVENAFSEFGLSTAKRWLQERDNIEWRLERYPTTYPPEELLAGRDRLYRRCSMMNRRFKLIYYHDEENDVVYVMDIWDTRRNPQTLIRSIR